MQKRDWFFSEYVDVRDLQLTVERCINRPLFILIYVLDKDLLIYGICKFIREKTKVSDWSFADEVLEDKVGEVVNDIIHRTFTTKKEVQNLLTVVGNEMIEVVAPNKASKELEKTGHW